MVAVAVRVSLSTCTLDRTGVDPHGGAQHVPFVTVFVSDYQRTRGHDDDKDSTRRSRPGRA